MFLLQQRRRMVYYCCYRPTARRFIAWKLLWCFFVSRNAAWGFQHGISSSSAENNSNNVRIRRSSRASNSRSNHQRQLCSVRKPTILSSNRRVNNEDTNASSRPVPDSDRKSNIKSPSTSSSSSANTNNNKEGNFAAVVSPIPMMPSPQFQELAMSQLELLASSIPISAERPETSKIKSMALYLPQENTHTGQLEFLPAILYPHPSQDRVFIANEADSGVAPALPRTLTTLPGFAHATSLLPDYPMVNGGGGADAGVGIVEEVMCDLTSGATALSVPLFSGSQTVGVLLVSPASPSIRKSSSSSTSRSSCWVTGDHDKVGRAAKSLSLALSMDSERMALLEQNRQVAEALSDSLHQLKNPLQAMRTYGKLLQRRLADYGCSSNSDDFPHLVEMSGNLLIQSDRLVERLKPVDSIVNMLGSASYPVVPLLEPAAPASKEIVHLPWESETLEFARTSAAPKSQPQRQKEPLDHDDGYQPQSRPEPESAASRTPTTSPPLFQKIDSSNRIALTDQSDLEMTFLDDVLGPIVGAFSGIAEEQNVEFVYESPDEDDLSGVFASPRALQEALVNIIDNAFTYIHLMPSSSSSNENNKNPNPIVRIRLVPNPSTIPPGVTILVEDNGQGIPEADRERIFTRGYRSTVAQEYTQGSGIGLDIARTIVEGMNGSLKVVSEQNKHCYPDSLQGAVMELVLFRQAF